MFSLKEPFRTEYKTWYDRNKDYLCNTNPCKCILLFISKKGYLNP